MRQPVTWDTVPYFGINGLSMILCLWSPLHPLSKLLAIQDHAQNLEEQLWMGGRREVSIMCYRPVTRQERFEARKVVFPWECLNIFATGCSNKTTNIVACGLVFSCLKGFFLRYNNIPETFYSIHSFVGLTTIEVIITIINEALFQVSLQLTVWW